MQTDANEPVADPIAAEVLATDAADLRLDALPPVPETRRRGFGAVVFGGVVAAIAGFALAQVVPQGWPLAATQDLSARLAAQSIQVDALREEVSGIPKTPPTDPLVIKRLTALESQPGFDPTSIENRVLALEARLAAIEKLPANGSGATAAAIAALQADMLALRNAAAAQNNQDAADNTNAQQKAAQTIAVETAKSADALATSVRRLAALGQLQAALDSGLPYAPALAQLATETDPIPPVLADFSESGLPTLSDLKTAFPPAARLGLDAALRANMGESWSERALSFLRSQTGARSLEPRDGSDPDAVLSRAEAALNTNDLAAVLAELQALPPEAQPAFADWRAKAETRLAAEQAIAAIAATIGE